MISIFIALVLGFMLSKFIPFPKGTQALIGKLSNFAIIFLLFTMGLTIGANPEVMIHLPSLGLKALVLASATVIGSTLAVWLTTQLFKGKRTAPNNGGKVH